MTPYRRAPARSDAAAALKRSVPADLVESVDTEMSHWIYNVKYTEVQQGVSSRHPAGLPCDPLEMLFAFEGSDLGLYLKRDVACVCNTPTENKTACLCQGLCTDLRCTLLRTRLR